MIQVSNPWAAYNWQAASIEQNIKRVLNSGRYINGEEIEKFEQEFAKYVGTEYCVACGSGTDAMTLAWNALFYDKKRSYFRRPHHVATVSLTAVGTIAPLAVANCGITFVDIDNSCTMDPEKLKKKLPGSIDCIVPVHLYGNPADMNAIKTAASVHRIPIIEDCCQAHGTKYQGQHVGTFGDLGVFSFYPTKNLGALGDGGAVVTNNSVLYDKLMRFREYGWVLNNRDATAVVGQSRLDPIQAAILRDKLQYLPQKILRRKGIAETYKSIFDHEKFEHIHWGFGASFHQFVMMLQGKEERKSFMMHMASQGIETAIHYRLPVHKQQAYHLSDPQTLQKTNEMCDRVVSLPIYPELTQQELVRVAEGVMSWAELS
jgi:dTDP-4-amino-4,6-dideoxygalactose transaminase